MYAPIRGTVFTARFIFFSLLPREYWSWVVIRCDEGYTTYPAMEIPTNLLSRFIAVVFVFFLGEQDFRLSAREFLDAKRNSVYKNTSSWWEYYTKKNRFKVPSWLRPSELPISPRLTFCGPEPLVTHFSYSDHFHATDERCTLINFQWKKKVPNEVLTNTFLHTNERYFKHILLWNERNSGNNN